MKAGKGQQAGVKAAGAGPSALGVRAYVGGMLYLEGIMVLLIGCSMLFTYWPPYAVDGERANPVSLVGAWIVGIAVAYMIGVGIILFLYSLLKPAKPEAVDPLRVRAHRYARLRPKGRYLFDDTVTCEADADEAHLARQLI